MRPMRLAAGLDPFIEAAGQMLARVAARFPDRGAIGAADELRLRAAGEAACRPPESRGEGAQGTAFVRPMRPAAWCLVMLMFRAPSCAA